MKTMNLLRKIFILFLCVSTFLTVNISVNANDEILDSNKHNLVVDSIEINEFNTSSYKGAIYLPYTDIMLSTPNGTGFSAKQYHISFSNEDVAEQDAIMGDFYPEATLISSANPLYNCHSYAWYNQSEDNIYWIDNPSVYYDEYDKSYIEVYDTPRKDDIICYYNGYGDAIHSGIVVDYYESDELNDLGFPDVQINIKSKWGDQGVYLHSMEKCPYTLFAHDYDQWGEETDEKLATTVRFYRPRVDGIYALNEEISTTTIDKTIFNNSAMENTYSMYEFNVLQSGYYNITVSSNNDLNIILYDNHMQTVDISYVNALNYTYQYILYLEEGLYYFRTAYSSNNDSGLIYLTIEYHSAHTYVYVPLNNTYHILMCDCGLTSGEKSIHTLKNSGGLGKYKPCTACGFLVNTGGTGIYPIEPYKVDDLIRIEMFE